MDKVYAKDIYGDKNEQLKSVWNKLPRFTRSFRAINEERNSVTTMIEYGYDYLYFFEFLITHNPTFRKNKAADFTLNDISKLTREDINEYVISLTEKKLAPSTINRKLTSLSVLFFHLIDEGKLTYNPLSGYKRKKLPKREAEVLDRTEVMELKYTIKTGYDFRTHRPGQTKNSERDFAIFILMLNHGLRISEILCLDLKDVDLRNGEITVIRKGDKEQVIYLSDEAITALKRYMEVRDAYLSEETKDTPALFLSTHHKRVSVRNVEYMLKNYLSQTFDEERVKELSPHKLRATFATIFYETNADIVLLQYAMGHRSINTTKRYIKPNEAALREARNLVSKEF